MKKYRTITFILSLLGLGFIGKLLSMIARILIVRSIGLEAISIYSLVNPMMLLLITLTQLGLPTAVSTLISRHPNKTKHIFISGLAIAMTVSIVLMISTILCGDIIANNIIQNSQCKLTIFGLALLIPLISLSSLLKGYFIGINRVEITTISSIFEEVGRILFYLLFIELFIKKGVEYASLGAMLGVCVGEISQSIYLLFQSDLKLYKKIKLLLKVEEYEDPVYKKDIYSIALPVTFSKLVGSITYFLEPIIFTTILLRTGESISYITLEYGKLTSYVLPLILMPGFFSYSLGNYLVPSMSKCINENNYKGAFKIFNKVLLILLIIGAMATSCFMIFPNLLLTLLYGDSAGYEMVRIIALPFLVYYLEAPILSAMHVLKKSKNATIISVISCIIRLITLLIFTKKLKIYAVAISMITSVLTNVIINSIFILREFSRNNIKARSRL